MATGVPRQAITRVFDVAKASPSDVDAIAIAQRVSWYQPEPIAWPGWFDGQRPMKATHFDRLGSTLAPLVGRSPLAWQTHHFIKRLLFRERLRKLPSFLRAEYGLTAPVRFYDHHYCHATSAYFTSGFDDALVVTLDGGGDGLSGSVYAGRSGRLERLDRVDSFNSLGNFYSYITALCGFKAELHEGKITGLAAYGEPEYADILRRFIRYEEPARIRYTSSSYHRSALQQLKRKLPPDFSREKLAASAQLVLEEIGLAFVRHWLRRTRLRNIAVAGGVFANVKLNQRVHELDEVHNFFVHPAMDDSGLSVGSALAAQLEARPEGGEGLIGRLPNVYLGPSYEESQIRQAMEAAGYAPEAQRVTPDRVAQLLAEGHAVARFWGRLEYGPRALGGRSILYQATDTSVNDWLNDRLLRTEFMPFAPATLAEHADRCYLNLEGAEDSARFMTVTFDCTEEMKDRSPGVVHLDGTARPQLVDAETAPDLYAILSAYHALTGNPSIINTSFNMHEEPIVCTPEDALRAFRQSNLEYLAIGDYLVRNPAPSRARRRREDQVSHSELEE